MIYNFDEVMDRSNNFSAKYDEAKNKFGRDDIIPLWIADMDLKTAQPIIDAMIGRANQGMFGYVSRPERYFELVREWQLKRNNWDVDTNYMAHATGVMPMMCHFMREFLNEGDKVIVQPPVYSEFFTAVKDWGGELVYNPLKLVDGDYQMDFEDLEKKLKDGAKFLIVCNPHNPVGRVWSREELTRLGNLCLENNVMVISDEIHSDLILFNNKHIPMASINEEFAKNTITCISATKTFNLAGLQVSTTVFPNLEMKKIYEDVQGKLDSKRNNAFSVVANMAAYAHGEEWLEQLLTYLEGNVEYINNFCKEHIPQIKPNTPDCTYLMWLDCKDLGLEGDKLVDFFINEARLGLNDGRSFGIGGEGYMRLNVACSRKLLEKAMNQLKEAVDKKNLGKI
ncbi:MalY/PatB family protein [Romboutsia sp. 1001713B170131_170501_G6]|uniref:MalY/PatB family protein n=1 Tax=Romboutsia sp. 1001713B170131_170501_G6 TaxID=2787108 RepID=UPI0018A9FFB3|nr:PatB family C-S lyase [Romboutsia sp. 1001713B170131_170501_G6]